MPTGMGVDPTIVNGTATSGTTAEDIRRIWGSLYTDGIVRGVEVTTSGTEMRYTINPGVVMIPFGAGQVTPSPYYGGSVVSSVGPTSGTRTDIVYIKQNIPSVEGNSDVVADVGTTLPARAVAIKQLSVGAGVTNSNAAIAAWDRRFAVPLSSGAGLLYSHVDQSNSVLPITEQKLGSTTLVLPTDRVLRISIKTILSATGASGFDNSKYCEYYFIPGVDNTDRLKWTTGGLHQAWETFYYEFDINVPSGAHTFYYKRAREVGPGTATAHYGIDIKGHGRQGTVFNITDIGPVA